jgi:hypothetical protein
VVEDFDQLTGETRDSINYAAHISNEDSDMIERVESGQPYIEMNIYSGKKILIVKRKYLTVLWAIAIIGNVFGMIGFFMKTRSNSSPERNSSFLLSRKIGRIPH